MRLPLILAFFALAIAGALRAGQDAAEAQLVGIDEGRVYRKVNDDNITGKDIIDLLMAEQWDKTVQAFIDYTILTDEVKAAKIEVSDEEVEKELQSLLKKYAEQAKINPGNLKIEDLAKQVGLASGLATLRKHTRLNVGLLIVFQKLGKLPPTAHTWERGFKELVGDLLDKKAQQLGVEKDPKKLGVGEAVRIGARGYNRDEVRAFGIDQVNQITSDELKEKLKVLTFDVLTQRMLKEKNLTLNEGRGGDLEFHYSYLCRKAEAQTGVPGDLAMKQQLQEQGMTPQEFMRTRIFRADAALTLLAKSTIRAKHLKVEFESHPERYKRSENLVAHVFVRVLDPDGRGYTPAWKAPGHDALNDYVARKREEQFAAARPKIEGLAAEAQRDFDETAKKYSDDNQTKQVGGKIGRVGEQTFLPPPADAFVREAALKLKPGEVSPPVRSNYGWHLIKCLDKQDVTFDEAAERVYMTLIHENKMKMQESLLNAAKIEDKF
jgi:parvulin-like peptidyl-prolyl isomerase